MKHFKSAQPVMIMPLLAPQGLMQAAVLAASPALAAALTRLLGGLHAEKASPGVDGLLLRLYRPILFRGLAAANGAVRRNALQLLLAAFPLQARRPPGPAGSAAGCRRQPGAWAKRPWHAIPAWCQLGGRTQCHPYSMCCHGCPFGVMCS